MLPTNLFVDPFVCNRWSETATKGNNVMSPAYNFSGSGMYQPKENEEVIRQDGIRTTINGVIYTFASYDILPTDQVVIEGMTYEVISVNNPVNFDYFKKVILKRT